jgi:hypothetical protein
MAAKFRKYEVTLRRDVQQAAVIQVDARSTQEAVETAEAFGEAAKWSNEKIVGSHRSKAQVTK